MPILKDLIETLAGLPQDAVLKDGIGKPHSYRGYYDCLAFVSTPNVRVADALKLARKQIGSVHHGWKGGEYTMSEYTDVYLADIGETGDALCLRCLRRDAGAD